MLRETGSVVVRAPPEAVEALLTQRMGRAPTSHWRFETDDSTLVLRDAPGGTRLVVARTARGPALAKPREELRNQVEAELYAMRKLIEG